MKSVGFQFELLYAAVACLLALINKWWGEKGVKAPLSPEF